jgi:hypothetical protein
VTDEGREIIQEAIERKQRTIAEKMRRETEEQNKKLQAAIDKDTALQKILHDTCLCGHPVYIHFENKYSRESAEPRYISKCRAAPWDMKSGRAVPCECVQFTSANSETTEWISRENERFRVWASKHFG